MIKCGGRYVKNLIGNLYQLFKLQQTCGLKNVKNVGATKRENRRSPTLASKQRNGKQNENQKVQRKIL